MKPIIVINLPLGMGIDRKITEPYGYDFFYGDKNIEAQWKKLEELRETGGVIIVQPSYNSAIREYKNNLFIAPVSYFIENLEGQERENFKNGVFQYDGMVCGMIEEINFEYKRFLVSFKAPEGNYAEPVITLSIDRVGVDLNKFHRVKSVQRINFYQFLKIKEQDIIDMVKNKDYD